MRSIYSGMNLMVGDGMGGMWYYLRLTGGEHTPE
ncbi:hypothetical protein LCGC14_2992630, partial [marine sediment metagenome]